jgi:Asp/Glu/hydantoin racemase
MPRMRLLIINPLATGLYDEDTAVVARLAVGSDTEIEVRHLADGVPETAYLPSQELFFNQLLSSVKQGEREGFDGIVIACASDPGLSDAKTLVSIPVTAPFEAAAYTAAAFGRMAVLYPGIESGEGENLPGNGNFARELARRYGVLDRFACALPVAVKHPTNEETETLFADNPQALRTLIRGRMREALAASGVAQLKRACEEYEADVAFFSCTFWGGMLSTVAPHTSLHLLDPVGTATAYAQSLVAGRQLTAKRSIE